jgi:hypothetical protein
MLDNSNYDHFHGVGEYVIMHKYFGKKPKMQKMNTYIFVYNLTCFLAWKFLAHVVDIWGHKL